jgi:8-oxo-dGTP diphosphatase
MGDELMVQRAKSIRSATRKRLVRSTARVGPRRRQRFAYEYPRPAVTVDCVLFRLSDASLETLLIRRSHTPFRGRWAFPGGFVDPDEPLEAAAARELVEETGARVDRLWPVGAFGDPGRDPRGWTISVAFYALVSHNSVFLRAGDDASAAAWHSIDHPPPLAFDHAVILARALDQMRHDLYVRPIALPLLTAPFTVRRLHQLYGLLDPAVSTPALLGRRLQDAGIIVPVVSKRGK